MILSDGSSFFILKEVQLTEAVYPGLEVSEQVRSRLERLSETRAAVRSALALLARAPHSRAGLRLKLLRRGHGEEAILAALQRAEEMGYLDDGRFAEEWVLLRLDRHPQGRPALVADLRERGVPRETAEGVVARIVTDAVEEEAFLRALRRASKAGSTDRGGRAGRGRDADGRAKARREAERPRLSRQPDPQAPLRRGAHRALTACHGSESANAEMPGGSNPNALCSECRARSTTPAAASRITESAEATIPP